MSTPSNHVRIGDVEEIQYYLDPDLIISNGVAYNLLKLVKSLEKTKTLNGHRIISINPITECKNFGHILTVDIEGIPHGFILTCLDAEYEDLIYLSFGDHNIVEFSDIMRSPLCISIYFQSIDGEEKSKIFISNDDREREEIEFNSWSEFMEKINECFGRFVRNIHLSTI